MKRETCTAEQSHNVFDYIFVMEFFTLNDRHSSQSFELAHHHILPISASCVHSTASFSGELQPLSLSINKFPPRSITLTPKKKTFAGRRMCELFKSLRVYKHQTRRTMKRRVSTTPKCCFEVVFHSPRRQIIENLQLLALFKQINCFIAFISLLF